MPSKSEGPVSDKPLKITPMALKSKPSPQFVTTQEMAKDLAKSSIMIASIKPSKPAHVSETSSTSIWKLEKMQWF